MHAATIITHHFFSWPRKCHASLVPSTGRSYRLLKVARTGTTSSLMKLWSLPTQAYSVILCQLCLTSEVCNETGCVLLEVGSVEAKRPQSIQSLGKSLSLSECRQCGAMGVGLSSVIPAAPLRSFVRSLCCFAEAAVPSGRGRWHRRKGNQRFVKSRVAAVGAAALVLPLNPV